MSVIIRCGTLGPRCNIPQGWLNCPARFSNTATPGPPGIPGTRQDHAMYAIIEDSGSQIKVSEGDTIRVDLRDLPDDAQSLTFDRVLMIGCSEKGATIGQPIVKGASVTADIVDPDDSEKINIVKFKRRKTYKRNNGHRQHYIKCKVTKINA
jgi:large subunit ribosomal protein L21